MSRAAHLPVPNVAQLLPQPMHDGPLNELIGAGSSPLPSTADSSESNVDEIDENSQTRRCNSQHGINRAMP